MPVLLKIPSFTAEEKDQLQRLEKFDSNWRVRERVKTLLLLSQGQTCLKVAGKIGIHFRTVSYTRQGWLQEKFASLADKPRCGAPLKMTLEEHARVETWAETAPLSTTELLARHLDAGGTPVHAQTIKSVLRKEEFVWKRTRARLKKRNETAFGVVKAEIAHLRSQAAAGHIVLGYLDEAGFSCIHPNS